MVLVTEEKDYSCSFCKKSFDSEESFKRHKSKQHKQKEADVFQKWGSDSFDRDDKGNVHFNPEKDRLTKEEVDSR